MRHVVLGVGLAALSVCHDAHALGGNNPVPTTTTLASSANPSFPDQQVSFSATVSGAGGGTVNFFLNGNPISGCVDLIGSPVDFITRRATCTFGLPARGIYPVMAVYSGDPYFAASSDMVDHEVVNPALSSATVVKNPYATFTVQGADVNGNTLSNFGNDVVITLGTGSAGPGAFEIHFETFRLGPGQTFAINALSGHQAYIVVTGGRAVVAGTVAMDQGYLSLYALAGLDLRGTVRADHLVVDALANDWYAGESVRNNGTLDGGARLQLFASGFTSDGIYAGNVIDLHTYGNANNPVNGAHYLDNGINLYPDLQIVRGSAPCDL